MSEKIEVLKAMLNNGYEYFADTDKGIVFRSKNKEGFIKFKSWDEAQDWLRKVNDNGNKS